MGDRTQYYEDLGPRFEDFMSDYDVERRRWLIFDRLLDGLSERGVLEVGSGTGRFSHTIAERGGRLTVLDIGSQLVTRVSGELGSAGVVGDACELPFADASFEVVVSSECVEHTLRPERAIREMCRVCRPGGVVCITSPNKLWYPVMRLSQRMGIRKFSGIENWMWPRRAAAIMHEEGMKNVKLEGCHLWPFQIRFTRPLLRRCDRLGRWLHPVMINFGLVGTKGAPST